MTDLTPNTPSTRIQIALEYLKAVETSDKATFRRLLSDEHFARITVPGNKSSQTHQGKNQVLKSAGKKDSVEVKSMLLDVAESVDGQVIIHVRWRCLRLDEYWVEKEEVRFISLVHGPGPFHDLQIGRVRVFVDWIGAAQWTSPRGAAMSSSTISQMYSAGMVQQPSWSPIESPKVLSIRTRIALEYLKALEQRDKDTLERLVSDEHYEHITVPLQKPGVKPRRKEELLRQAETQSQLLTGTDQQDHLEVKITPLYVFETLDGRVIMHDRWRSLRKDGLWVETEEVSFISFVDGAEPFDEPQIGHVKMFVDWVGRSQWVSPQKSARTTLGAMYHEIMGLRPLPPPQGGGVRCTIM